MSSLRVAAICKKEINIIGEKKGGVEC